MPAPKKYDPNVHDDWAWALAVDGATDVKIAKKFGVTERTINRWKFERDENGKVILDEKGDKVLTSFGKSLNAGKEIADAKVEKSLFKRATGFSYSEAEKYIDIDPKTGAPKITRTRVTDKHVPPDVMAIMYWLNNRSRKTGKWSQKQVVEVEGLPEPVGYVENVVRETMDRMTDNQLKAFEEICKLYTEVEAEESEKANGDGSIKNVQTGTEVEVDGSAV